MGALLKIAASVAGIFENLASWLRSRADQKTGAQLQQGADSAATIKENINAQADSDHNRALTRQQLIDGLRGDGAGRT